MTNQQTYRKKNHAVCTYDYRKHCHTTFLRQPFCNKITVWSNQWHRMNQINSKYVFPQFSQKASHLFLACTIQKNDKKAEWIKIPKKCRHLGLTNSAERILDEWNKTYIAEKYKAQFREFTDISTIGERLKENRQQIFIYENIFENKKMALVSVRDKGH